MGNRLRVVFWASLIMLMAICSYSIILTKS